MNAIHFDWPTTPTSEIRGKQPLTFWADFMMSFLLRPQARAYRRLLHGEAL